MNEIYKPMNVIEIWQPRYKDNMVLVATYKVKSGYNYLRFTKAKHLEGKLFRFHSTDINTNNVQRNGNAVVYVIPMEKLELVEDVEEKKPVKHTYKVEIDGKVKEFDNADDFLTELSNLVSGGLNE